jgi:hypothetical protein
MSRESTDLRDEGLLKLESKQLIAFTDGQQKRIRDLVAQVEPMLLREDKSAVTLFRSLGGFLPKHLNDSATLAILANDLGKFEEADPHLEDGKINALANLACYCASDAIANYLFEEDDTMHPSKNCFTLSHVILSQDEAWIDAVFKDLDMSVLAEDTKFSTLLSAAKFSGNMQVTDRLWPALPGDSDQENLSSPTYL